MNAPDQPLAAEVTDGEFEAPSVEALGEQLPQYEIHELVAKGGMGAVYLGYQTQLERKVAIKVLRSDDTMGAEYQEHFRSEARAMAKLQHSNIVAVYDFGETESGLHYIVMEYAEGSTLFDLIHDGVIDPQRVLEVMAQVCAALQYAHERGVVHRDVKPANILVAPDGCVKMADFGLAKLQGNAGGLGDALFGTPEYAAPEVRDPKVEVDHRADIYSAGVLIFEMLVGEAPAPGSNDVPSRHVDSDPRFDRIVTHATNILPSGRYQQASELAAELEKIRANPGGRQLRVGAAAKQARKGRAANVTARPAPVPVAAPVKAVAPVVAAPVAARAVAVGAVKRPRPAPRPLPVSGGGGSNALVFVLVTVVVVGIILVISAMKKKDRAESDGKPAKEAVDPLKEAESTLR